MEIYQGVKFEYTRVSTSFIWDQRLEVLNYWTTLFTELGLAPLHGDGAYGNQSYRTSPSSFFITRSAMKPQKNLHPADYVHVTGFDTANHTFIIEGTTIPSSESFLHNSLYEALPDINAILHGHSSLLSQYAEDLGIPVTQKFHDYGTPELAESALKMTGNNCEFFILKDHGFVALGKNIETAGKLTLDYYSELIKFIKNN